MSNDRHNLHEFASAVLRAQPFSRLLGAELVSVTPEAVQLGLTVTDELRQQYGMAHGGVIAYPGDNSLTFAGGLALGGDVVTAQMNIHYLNPARGDRLLARAEIISVRGSSALTRCAVVELAAGGEETDIAFATGLIRRIGNGRND